MVELRKIETPIKGLLIIEPTALGILEDTFMSLIIKNNLLNWG